MGMKNGNVTPGHKFFYKNFKAYTYRVQFTTIIYYVMHTCDRDTTAQTDFQVNEGMEQGSTASLLLHLLTIK